MSEDVLLYEETSGPTGSIPAAWKGMIYVGSWIAVNHPYMKGKTFHLFVKTPASRQLHYTWDNGSIGEFELDGHDCRPELSAAIHARLELLRHQHRLEQGAQVAAMVEGKR